MVTCSLQGGLGNQMFQIAATHALALRNKTTSCFDFYICHTPMQGSPSMKYKNNIFSKITHGSTKSFNSLYLEKGFSYNEIPYEADITLYGYFQSEKYFIDYKKEILDLFTIPNENLVSDFLVGFKGMGKPIVTVHVRRGDYLANPDFHPVCPIEYYNKAMVEMGDCSFIFVSDDMQWIQDNFRGPNIWYSMFTDELADLKLMTMVDHNIISNSSFSWWGAYLNQNPNKKVIAPKQWFGPKGPKDTQDIIPSDWTIIS